ncbi:MAG: arylsulfatase [Planctomycetaceae bacterium]
MPSTAAGSGRPNIIVILSDDMGYSDIGCFGGEIATPNLDSLAANGLRFTQFYNTSRCCPTRASLLTGLYPHQAGIGHMMEDRGHPGYRGDLNRNSRTMAEVLRPAGYSTYAVGKWHVTPKVTPGSSQHNWPLQRGFDRYYGTIHGAGSFFDPNSLVRDNTLISPITDAEYRPETYYYTDAISDHASRFIQEHVDAQRSEPLPPFFMYVAYTAAHWPMHALPEDIQKYRGKYGEGYGPIREMRLQRMRELGLVHRDLGLSPQAENWSVNPLTDWEIRCMEVYAAMVDRMDQGIGKLVETLKRTGQFDNTLILYTQDNGGCAEGLGRNPSNAPAERLAQPTLAPLPADYLQPDMIPKQTRDGFPMRQGAGVMPGAADTYIAYGRGWANVSNSPFREYKHWVHEGGISTPLIAHWPRGIARKGELDHQPGHLIDIMATCVDVSGADYPQAIDGEAIHPLEGRSLVPAFRGETIERKAIYWEHEANRAIRVGNWKLVAKENQPWELYDIGVDRIEANDLAAKHPERVTELSAMWDDWAARANVLPLGTWKANNAGRKQSGSNKRRFVLTSDADLPQSDAPAIAQRGFRVDVDLAAPGTAGVLVAQGGDAHGFVMYLQDGELRFGVCRDGVYSEVAAKLVAAVKGTTLTARLAADGKVTLSRDDERIGQHTVAGLVTSMPVDGLQVGRDLNGTVGDYVAPFAFDGAISEVRIELDKR